MGLCTKETGPMIKKTDRVDYFSLMDPIKMEFGSVINFNQVKLKSHFKWMVYMKVDGSMAILKEKAILQ
jgi:hypothetical protein